MTFTGPTLNHRCIWCAVRLEDCACERRDRSPTGAGWKGTWAACPPGVLMVGDERRRWRIIDDKPIKDYKLTLGDAQIFAEINGCTAGTLVIIEEKRVSASM